MLCVSAGSRSSNGLIVSVATAHRKKKGFLSFVLKFCLDIKQSQLWEFKLTLVVLLARKQRLSHLPAQVCHSHHHHKFQQLKVQIMAYYSHLSRFKNRFFWNGPSDPFGVWITSNLGFQLCQKVSTFGSISLTHEPPGTHDLLPSRILLCSPQTHQVTFRGGENKEQPVSWLPHVQKHKSWLQVM